MNKYLLMISAMASIEVAAQTAGLPPPDFISAIEGMESAVGFALKTSLFLVGAAVFIVVAWMLFRQLTYFLTGHNSSYISKPEKISHNEIKKNKETTQIDKLLSLKTSDMNRQIGSVINKCEKVHKRYQDHPDVSYRRSDFYNGDIPLITEYVTTYRKMDVVDKESLDELVSAMKTYETKLDDIDSVFNSQLKMKLLTLSDTIKAKSR